MNKKGDQGSPCSNPPCIGEKTFWGPFNDDWEPDCCCMKPNPTYPFILYHQFQHFEEKTQFAGSKAFSRSILRRSTLILFFILVSSRWFAIRIVLVFVCRWWMPFMALPPASLSLFSIFQEVAWLGSCRNSPICCLVWNLLVPQPRPLGDQSNCGAFRLLWKDSYWWK